VQGLLRQTRRLSRHPRILSTPPRTRLAIHQATLEEQIRMGRCWKERVENLWLSQYAEEPAAAVAMPIAIPLNIMEEYRAQGFTQPPDRTLRSDLDDDYSRWLRRRPTTCSDPINWWSTAGASEYPRLARMALDLLTILAMSDEAERLFSRLVLMITDRRNQLEQPTIQVTQCLFSWDKAGIIDLEAAQMPAGPGIAIP
jgi:hypothetical protein